MKVDCMDFSQNTNKNKMDYDKVLSSMYLLPVKVWMVICLAKYIPIS